MPTIEPQHADYARWLRRKRPLRWSWQNWRKGYQFRPIQRCRRCDHTSPYHYPTCIHRTGYTDD